MHGLNGMKSSVYFSCCTVIKKKYGAHASAARAGDKIMHNTHTFAFLTEIHESIERAGDGRWMSLAPGAKKVL